MRDSKRVLSFRTTQGSPSAAAMARGAIAAICLSAALGLPVPTSAAEPPVVPAPSESLPAASETGPAAPESLRADADSIPIPPEARPAQPESAGTGAATDTLRGSAADTASTRAPGTASAPQPPPRLPVPRAPEGGAAVAPVPFGPGEIFEYKVSVGLFGDVGHGSMEVVGIDTVREHPTYHIRMKVRGGIPFAHVDDRLESWVDIRSLASRRFEQDQKEPKWKRHKIWNFFPEQKSWATEDPSQVGTLPTDLPLDDASFLYYVRTLPLEVGRTDTLNRYFRAEGNPVIIQFVRTQEVSVPSGKFQTVVVRPIIRTRGLFGQGGEAEVYLTNDARRIPVMVRSKIPVLGHLNLELERYTFGVPVSGGVSWVRTPQSAAAPAPPVDADPPPVSTEAPGDSGGN